MNTEQEKEKTQEAKKVAKEIFSSWVDELESKDQPKSCSIDDTDCEACGS
tara:strand:+ start:2375 stop:2524 length:150 start_codon:yes stop_codon:yes gene_type:complete